MSVHDATFDPSTIIKHASNLLRVMITIIGTNESIFPFYLVGLDKDGSGNLNQKHVRNQIAILVLFILGIMDKLNMTCGCPGLSFLNIADRSMVFLNIGISGIVLKSNGQIGNEFWIDEVIGNASLIKSVRETV